MVGLFRRLKRIGYDGPFLRSAILPDWWEDSLADNPVTLAQIQLRIAHRLGLPLADILNPSKDLSLQDLSEVRLKRAKSGTARKDVTPGMVAARNTVRIALPFLRRLPPLPANLTPLTLRKWVLGRNSTVDLAGLLEACWAHGIAVFHYSPLPTASKKFAGMAYYEADRPVIVLASGYDEPARLTFHLAHEVAHVIRGHVQPGGPVLCDANFDGTTEDREETEADKDALELLTGKRDPILNAVFGLTAAKLVTAVRSEEHRSHIHPGTLALIYGKTARRMPVAVNALKLMNMGSGARRVIAAALERHLPKEDAATAELPGVVREILPLFGLECPA
jgi:hypothetical protein